MMPSGYDSKDDDAPIIPPPVVTGRVNTYTVSISRSGLEIVISWSYHTGYTFEWVPSNRNSDQPIRFRFSHFEEAKASATEILTAEYYVKLASTAVEEKLNKALERGIV